MGLVGLNFCSRLQFISKTTRITIWVYNFYNVLIVGLLLTLFPGLLAANLTTPQGNWCYEGQCGPGSWIGKCKFGKIQSPVDIELRKAKRTQQGKRLVLSKAYYEYHTFFIQNTGHTVQITPSQNSSGYPEEDYTVVGAGFKGKYHLAQLHFHWGSEHTFRGVRFPLELHVVHIQNSGAGGVGVLSVVFQLTEFDNLPLQPIIEMLPKVLNPTDSPIELERELNIAALLPNVWDVYRYEGSLTTPPCSEQVLWSVFTKRVPISKKQMNEFKKLLNKEGKPIRKNFRPTKPVVTGSRSTVYYMPIDSTKMREEAFNYET